MESLNKCIYCGSTEGLTDEHIIPFAMGGDLVLPKSSCKKCASMTSLFERRVLRGFMYQGRVLSKLPSRRKKSQPKSFETHFILGNNKVFSKDVLIENGISVIHLPAFIKPGFLEGRVNKDGISIAAFDNLYIGTDPTTLLLNNSATGIKFKTIIEWKEFCQLLAKIAHGHLVSKIGFFPLNESPILPLIFGSKVDFGTWIGSDEVPLFATESKALHVIGTIDAHDENGRIMTSVIIRLFNSWGMQSCYIVAARLVEKS